MREILLGAKEKILEDIVESFRIENESIKEIRINMTAVFKCVYGGKQCIMKYLLSGGDHIDEDMSTYLGIHADNMVHLSSCKSFPEIFEYKYIEIEEYEFLVVIEELFQYEFYQGIEEFYRSNGYNILKTCKEFLLQILEIYIAGYEYGFISHRDLSFDNMMFNDQFELKMIDLGSAKSTYGETTVLHIQAPTKLFYSAPEYEALHKDDRSNEDLVLAEIYTIGLLALSLLGILYKETYLQSKSKNKLCGIRNWIDDEKISQLPSERLSEENKKAYINYILINVFEGDDSNLLFRILCSMVDKSKSSRLSSYNLISKYLRRD